MSVEAHRWICRWENFFECRMHGVKIKQRLSTECWVGPPLDRPDSVGEVESQGSRRRIAFPAYTWPARVGSRQRTAGREALEFTKRVPWLSHPGRRPGSLAGRQVARLVNQSPPCSHAGSVCDRRGLRRGHPAWEPRLRAPRTLGDQRRPFASKPGGGGSLLVAIRWTQTSMLERWRHLPLGQRTWEARG